MNQRKATLIGLVAVVLWSSIVGLIRGVSESLGAVGGAAMMYSVASVLLLFTVGFPKISADSTLTRTPIPRTSGQ